MKHSIAVGICLLVVAAAIADESPRPNIILVMTDDQGYGDLACHGNPIIQTPRLDAFYQEAVRFTDFHVSPTCAPTRSALMTGRHEFKNGVTHTINERERLTPKAFTVAQLLKSKDYTTGIFGKWHLGDEAEYQPGKRGFDEVFIHGAGGIGQTYVGSCGDAPNNTYFNPAILHNGTFEKTKGYCTDVFFNQAIGWIDQQRQAGKPFFAYITPNCPHAPLDCPPEYEAKYTGKVPPNVAKFYGMITNIDDNVGRLLDKLKEWGIEGQTLVIFMTDNGTATGETIFNAGMRGKKGTPYQGGTRVPALWRWPGGFLGGRDLAQLTAHIDIFPTFAEITGAKLPAEFVGQVEGRSLWPLLKGDGQWSDRTLVTHVGRWEKGRAAEGKYAACSIRNSRFSLVNAAREGEKWELFDLASDPGEKTNVLDQHPDVAKVLKTGLDQWWNEVRPLLVNEDAVGPAQNPFKVLYWKQFGGGPADADQAAAGDTEIRPFRIDVDRAVLDDLKSRLAMTRWPDEIDAAGWDYGVPTSYLRELTDYWRTSYDWRKYEAELNGFPQFITNIDGVDLHFLHVRSKHEQALPLVLVHGWPGSIWEFHKVIGPLVDPEAHGGMAKDAFHVVVPALPGFGFSGKPKERGWSSQRMAESIAKLMARLGYQRYGAQGGDWGGGIVRWLASGDGAHCIGSHSNFPGGNRPMDDPMRGVTEAELARFEQRVQELSDHKAYGAIQGTRPQTLGYGLNDSPAALAAWVVDKFWAWSDHGGDLERSFTKDELLTNVMIYWVTQSMPSSTRIYYESQHNQPRPPLMTPFASGGKPSPVGYALFPKEINVPPRAWVERSSGGTLIHWTEMPRGGHFAALEEPELLVEDVRVFFRKVKVVK